MSMFRVVLLVAVMGATVGAPGCPRDCQCFQPGLQVSCAFVEGLEPNTSNSSSPKAPPTAFQQGFPSGSTSITIHGCKTNKTPNTIVDNQTSDYLLQFLNDKLRQQEKLQQLTLTNCDLSPNPDPVKEQSTENQQNTTKSAINITLAQSLKELTLKNCSLVEIPNFFPQTQETPAKKQEEGANNSTAQKNTTAASTIIKISFVPPTNAPNSLRLVDLSSNVISVVNSGRFRTLSKLQVLLLSANAIDRVATGGFAGLGALQRLDLSSNRLKALDGQIFRGLTSLQQLNLSRNALEVLDELCFVGLQRLQQLDMSWNRLARVNPGTLQLPSLARLLLAGNPTLGAGSPEPSLLVGTGRRLQTVDVSRTGLVQVPAALTHSVRTLRLAANSIQTVQCGDLDSYPLLQLLDLTSNTLDQIEEDALGRLDALTILYLSDNKLKNIPLSLPTRLRIVHLERNQIQKISLGDLQGLTKLEVLLLNDNQIKVIDEGAFGTVAALASLDLSRNPTVSLPPGALQGPRQLQVLRLAGLGLEGGSSRMNPEKSAEKAVPMNKSIGVEADQFPLLTPEYLVTLDLGRSPDMARILLEDTATLAAFRELQELDIRGCNLQDIRSDLRHFLPQLRVLHIGDNPLNCSNLEWLASWMRRQDQPEYRMVTCFSPPEVAGTLLIDLQEEETALPPTLLTPSPASPALEDEGETTEGEPQATTSKTVIAKIQELPPKKGKPKDKAIKTEVGTVKQLFPASNSRGVFEVSNARLLSVSSGSGSSSGSSSGSEKKFQNGSASASDPANGTGNVKVNPVVDFYRKRKVVNVTATTEVPQSAYPVLGPLKDEVSTQQEEVVVPTNSSVYVNNNNNKNKVFHVSNNNSFVKDNDTLVVSGDKSGTGDETARAEISSSFEIQARVRVDKDKAENVPSSKNPLPAAAEPANKGPTPNQKAEPEAPKKLVASTRERQTLYSQAAARASNYSNKAPLDSTQVGGVSEASDDNNIFIASLGSRRTPATAGAEVSSGGVGDMPQLNNNSQSNSNALSTTSKKADHPHGTETTASSPKYSGVEGRAFEKQNASFLHPMAPHGAAEEAGLTTLTAGEMSPYQMSSSLSQDMGAGDAEDLSTDVTQHPGMLVLAIGILLSVTALGTLASRVSRRRRAELYSRQQDIEIEVSSMGAQSQHTTELW